jgi:hypothetical protein
MNNNNYCVNCYTDLGRCNPRQYCYKTFCPYTLPEDITTINDNIINKLRYENKLFNKIINKLILKYKSSNNQIYLKCIKYYDFKILKNVKNSLNLQKY